MNSFIAYSGEMLLEEVIFFEIKRPQKHNLSSLIHFSFVSLFLLLSPLSSTPITHPLCITTIGGAGLQLIMTMEGGSSGSEDENEKELKELLKETMDEKSEWCDRYASRFKMHSRIMKLSMTQLREEAMWKFGEERSMFHLAAGNNNLPLHAINRLCDALDVDSKDMYGRTAVMLAAYFCNSTIVELLARKKQADLSIVDVNGINVFNIIEVKSRTSRKEKKIMYRVLKDNGVTSATIIKGLRSPLSGIYDDSLLIPNRLAYEESDNRLYIRAMTLSLAEFEEEAKERKNDENGWYLLSLAARWGGMEVVLERIQSVWAASVNALATDGASAITQAAFSGRAGYVRAFATMGSDFSIKSFFATNVFDAAELSIEPPEKKAAVLKALAEHSITSRNIPPRFQSPLYFRSIYYKRNVITQRWINRSSLILCANYLYNWSVENQDESEYYRSLPSDLTGVGYFVAHCLMHVDGGYFSNRICRLITQFYGGFDESKSSFALIGMPELGKVPETRTRCSCCEQHSKKELLQCCSRTRYCSTKCQVAHFKKHKKVCDRKAFLAKRVEVAARVAALREMV
jgi:ankyrin repeat protein